MLISKKNSKSHNHKNSDCSAYKNPQKGAGLIEVMVTLSVLGVGMLGAMSLQVNGMNAGQRAVFTTEAQLLAQDMADRIMAFNSDGLGANAGEYDETDTNEDTGSADCSSSAGCDEELTVTFDRAEWRDQFDAASLPGGRGLVTWNDPIYTIQVMWDREREGVAVSSCDADGVACFEMEVRL